MELRHLRYFVAVATELHFGRAAKRLNLAQPAISQQIQALENELGVKLLERNRRRVALTSAGTLFLESARQLLKRAETAIYDVRRAAEGHIGRLRIGHTDEHLFGFVPNVISAFQTERPNVVVELLLGETPDLVDAMTREEIDVAFVYPPLPSRGASLASLTIARERPIVVLPENHALAKRRRIYARDLARERFVLPPAMPVTGYNLKLIQIFEEAGFTPTVISEAYQVEMIVSLVASGRGVSILSENILRFRGRGAVFVPLCGSRVSFDACCIWSNSNPSVTLSGFLEVVRHRL